MPGIVKYVLHFHAQQTRFLIGLFVMDTPSQPHVGHFPFTLAHLINALVMPRRLSCQVTASIPSRMKIKRFFEPRDFFLQVRNAKLLHLLRNRLRDGCTNGLTVVAFEAILFNGPFLAA